jgi:gamma-glutamylcyclotransferase (GGCT)/AIG2-like uncharacterized protein YtfP
LAAQPSDATDLVFVYGLLKRGFSLHHHMSLGVFVGDAAVSGLLYSLGQYPGLVEGTGTVRGEVFRFDDIAVALEVLDEVEGYDPFDVDNSEYVRVIKQARLDANGRSVATWCYAYNKPVAKSNPIKSGAWLEARST